MTESPVHSHAASSFSSKRRNYMLTTHRKDGLIEWMIEILNHSFVLDARETYFDSMVYFEELVQEHRRLGERSRLRQYVPSVGQFHTPLPMRKAFQIYDEKYYITKRRFIAPSFNEIRHILNLSQIMAIGENLKLITFDGDQTLYNDGGNFQPNDELALAIIHLLRGGVKVAVVTAAGYGLVGWKYEQRLQGLLDRFVSEGLGENEVKNFYVFGGECNYLLTCTYLQPEPSTEGSTGLSLGSPKKARLVPVPVEEWQAESLKGPRPVFWPEENVKRLLDVTEQTLREGVTELHLRARILRKERAIGVFPGGDEMCNSVPKGHGSRKLKREALDELVLRVMNTLRIQDPPIKLPYCVFNGGTDVWLDVGNKSVGVAALQAFLGLDKADCLHVGDQFLHTGNDFAARQTCPCIWIINPRETGKVLQFVLKYKNIPMVAPEEIRFRSGSVDIRDGEVPAGPSSVGSLCVYTGEMG